MKDIVTKILKEEQEIRSSLEKARAEAGEFLARMHTQAASMADSAAAELKIAAERDRAEAERAFTAEKEKIIAETKHEAVELREKRSRDIPQLARQIFAQITEIKL
jgi:hypothetical protein